MKPRTCYIAGRFERRDEFLEYERQLAEVQITSCTRWLHMETDMRLSDDEKRRHDALVDLEDLRNADFLLSFSEDLEGLDTVPALWARGGRHVEFGFAIAEGHHIVVVGPKENIFHYLSDQKRMWHFDTFGDFMDWWKEQ